MTGSGGTKHTSQSFIGKVGEEVRVYLHNGQRAARLPCGRMLVVQEGCHPFVVDRNGVRTELEFK